jgi:hypothetical protein
MTNSTRALVRGLGLALALALVAAGAISIAGSLARDSQRQQVGYSGVRVLDLDVGVEDVEVLAGPGSSVSLDRTLSWSWRRPSTTERLDGDRLVLRSSCPPSFGRGCSGRLRLVVPADVEVRAHSSGGDVRVSGLTGPLDLSSSGGDVRGDGLGSESVAAESDAGDVQLVMARPPGRVTATSSGGDVDVRVPGDSTTYRVDASSSAGSRDVDVRIDPGSPRTIRVESSAGDVRVGYPAP